jgi:hypothetical protein
MLTESGGFLRENAMLKFAAGKRTFSSSNSAARYNINILIHKTFVQRPSVLQGFGTVKAAILYIEVWNQRLTH